MSLNRHQIRENAFKIVFVENSDSKEDLTTIKNQVLESMDLLDEDNKFLDELIVGVSEHKKEIDQLISEQLKKGWSVDRLEKPDRAILELAVFELKYTDTPNSVIINEAIELSKKYTDDKARKFINAILSAVAK